MSFRCNPDPSELAQALELLRSDNVLITYHGTTKEQAEKILAQGFKSPNLFEILMEAYRLTGLTREVRRTLPRWALEYITESEIIPRLIREHYTAISFAPHGVASRWAGWGGEVLRETVRQINIILAFMESDFPKTQESFETYCETISFRDFYVNLGEPIVLKAWVKVDDKQSKRIQRDIEACMKDATPEEAWYYWNFNYRDDRVRDPSQILKVEIAEAPFTGLAKRNPDENRRQIERQAAQGGIDAQAKLLQSRIRAGELRPSVVQVAAGLGHPFAQYLYPNASPVYLSDWATALAEGGLHDTDPKVRKAATTFCKEQLIQIISKIERELREVRQAWNPDVARFARGMVELADQFFSRHPLPTNAVRHFLRTADPMQCPNCEGLGYEERVNNAVCYCVQNAVEEILLPRALGLMLLAQDNISPSGTQQFWREFADAFFLILYLMAGSGLRSDEVTALIGADLRRSFSFVLLEIEEEQ